jgi:hypothetical protein
MKTLLLTLILSTSPIIDTQTNHETNIDSKDTPTKIIIINQNGLTTITTKNNNAIVDTSAFYGTCSAVSIIKRSDEVVCETINGRHFYTKLDPLDAPTK